jgi:hypothetical protein
MRMTERVVVAERFRGPPRSGNGGYVCGLVGRFVEGPAEVTLRLPPPLDTPLDVVRDGDELSLREGDREIARGRRIGPLTDVAPPPSPGRARAELATAGYRGHVGHVFGGCFACGPDRAPGDGLRLFTGEVTPGLVAAPWTPDASLVEADADADGLVAEAVVWAALDCPSYWALPRAGDVMAVLGRLSAEITRRPRAGEELVVAGWPLESSGRKHRSASALYDASGAVVARAVAVWIEVKREQFL